MIDYVIIASISIMVGLATRYVIKEKKRGTKCIGCAASAHCHQKKQTKKMNRHCNTD